MKKILVMLTLFLSVTVLVGCAGIFNPVESTSRTFLTKSTTQETTINSVDEELIISELYKRIYDSLYEQVKEEVLNDIAEERFQTLYESVIGDLLEEIQAGNITVDAESVIDMILSLEANQSKAVIGVKNLDGSGTAQSVGSGVIYKSEGSRYYVLTNNHVVENGSSYKVVFEDETEITATLRGVDELVDLAVLYFDTDQTLPVVSFGDSSALQKGEIIIAVGHPSGFTYYGSMTMGIISGLQRYFDIDNDGINDMFVGYIQHDAAINSGNSGGALFNIYGELIGVNVIKLTSIDIEGMGFAIPSNLVQAIVEDIEIYGYSKQKPVLGIRFVDIKNNQDYFIQNGITLPDGVVQGFYILEVEAGKTMEEYILPGDVVTRIGDVTIYTSRQFVEEFSKYRVGDIIDVELIRNEETVIITDIVLKAAPWWKNYLFSLVFY